jgi:2,3-diketo-5-methylthio-1-phosphopentane phosphatase
LTSRLADRGIGVVLLDIEGTTTPIAFVHETLFPYARRRVRAFLAAHDDELDVRRARDLLVAEHAIDLERDAPPLAPPKSIDALVDYVEWLMDRDRKSPGLKLLQGEIWEQGYRSGELRGLVFDDVAPAIRRWHDAGLRVAIYSSGSELVRARRDAVDDAVRLGCHTRARRRTRSGLAGRTEPAAGQRDAGGSDAVRQRRVLR